MSDAIKKFKGTPFRGNATARAHEKRRTVCYWLLQWGWSSAHLIQQVSGTSTPAQARRLVRAGLLRVQQLNGTGLRAGFLLTVEGARLAQAYSRYAQTRLESINCANSNHDLLVQQIVLQKLKIRECVGFFSARVISMRTQDAGIKIPDAIVFDSENKSVLIEVELNGKWDRRLDEFVARSIESLENGVCIPEKISAAEIHIYSTSNALIDRYKKAFEPDTPFFNWVKNGNGEYRRNGMRFVPEWAAGKIKFFKV